METNCRKLVSACVQLGKTRFSCPVPRRETAPLEGGERAPALLGGRGVGRFPEGRTRAGRKSEPGCWRPHLWGAVDREGAARRIPKPQSPPLGRSSWQPGRSRERMLPALGGQRVGKTGVPSCLPSNWVSALCPSFSSVLPPPTPSTRAAFRGDWGLLSPRTWGWRARPRRAAGGR